MSKEPLNLQELDRNLSQLASRMAICEEGDKEQILALAKDFSAWVNLTAGLSSFPTNLQAVQIRQILQGLKSGRPLAQVCQRLSQTIAEAVHHMGLILGEKNKAADTPAQAAPSPSAPVQPSVYTIKPDDLLAFKEFTAEAPELLQDIESGLLSLVQKGTWDAPKVYRAFHNFKGICGFMGMAGLAKLAHESEALLEKYKNGQGHPSDKEVDLLFAAGDLTKKQMEMVSRGLNAGHFELVDVEPFLRQLAGVKDQGPAPTAKAAVPAGGEVENPTHTDHFLRIGVEKMDILLETVGELAICQSQVTAGIAASGMLGHLATEASRLAKISRQLQEIVLSLRMVPVNPLFQRMSRLARDLSQKTGKPLRVEVEGGDTELDKRLTEELVVPLVHLIRNAADHGIENAEGRKKAGKPEEAVISLKASQQGGDFLLRVGDDGTGLDYEKLRRKGTALGYLNQGDVSIERLTELIFLPGFSTADKVTEVSGRGVGLDAVRGMIQSLKGSIQIESETGKGTTFLLRVPLTMALIDGIVVRVDKARYILPSFNVRQFLAFEETESHQFSKSREWLTTSFGNIPVVELSEWFGVKAQNNRQSVVVHLQVGDKEACLIVDEVVGKQQVVVKGLGEHLQGLPGVAGGAILGDGQVGFILDLNAIVQGGRTNSAPASAN